MGSNEKRIERIGEILEQLADQALPLAERADLERELAMLGQVEDIDWRAAVWWTKPRIDMDAIYARRAELDWELSRRRPFKG